MRSPTPEEWAAAWRAAGDVPEVSGEPTLRPCPFCGGRPVWLRRDMGYGTGASGMEAPMRALGCANEACAVQPRTRWRDTEAWAPGKGYFRVDHDAEAIADWNRRGRRATRAAAESTETEA